MREEHQGVMSNHIGIIGMACQHHLTAEGLFGRRNGDLFAFLTHHEAGECRGARGWTRA